MKKRSLLLSLLAILLFSCKDKPSDVLPQKPSEIQQLEQDYGITFKEITGEVDTTNSLIIPFEELKQLLESTTLGTRANYSTRGEGIYIFDKLFFSFERVSLPPQLFGTSFLFKLVLEFEAPSDEFSIDIGSTLLSEFSLCKVYRNSNEAMSSEPITDKTWDRNLLIAKSEVVAKTYVSGTWYNLDFIVYLQLRVNQPKAIRRQSFIASLTLTYRF